MGETKKSENWTSTQAYVISVICLLVGVAFGYLLRGSAPSPVAAVAQAQGQLGGNGASAAGGVSANGGAQQPTPEELRQMADTQAQPLLAELKTEPNNAQLLYKIGNLYYDAQQYPEAVKYYDSSLKVDPKATDVRTDLGTAYHLMGQADQAIKRVRRCAEDRRQTRQRIIQRRHGQVAGQDGYEWRHCRVETAARN